ncbi:hypothetical protein NAP1_08712 [Erythrobacter sp. NAP1]|uniref:hypothetical protein n=1 Tax=Erythrobacter sp. NAP1 TaxID=237727 RepID=UPI0000685231|nr:hypothetical protein [Erythrobacter sp. NAP1]EAQ27661.1 hypothetical protein NAP1_08712 [Erythrobacter sp. NAP1]
MARSLLILAIFAAAACVPAQRASGNAAAQANGPDAVEPRATRIARSLAEAEAAYTSGEQAKLASLVGSLRASGLAKHAEAEDDALATWSDATGAEAAPYRGRLLGPAYVRGELAAGEVWRSAQTFKSGVPSTLAVSHEGSGPVRMKVRDQSARAICDPGRVNKPACRFTPMYTQRYEIELVNEGTGRAVYFLVFD